MAAKFKLTFVFLTAICGRLLAMSNPHFEPVLPLEGDAARADVVAIVDILSVRGLDVRKAFDATTQFYDGRRIAHYQDTRAKVIEVLPVRTAASQPADRQIATTRPGGPDGGATIRILEVYQSYDYASWGSTEPPATQPVEPGIQRNLRAWPMVGYEKLAFTEGRHIVFLKRMEGTDIFGLYRAWPATKQNEAFLRRAVDITKWAWGPKENGLQMAVLPQPWNNYRTPGGGFAALVFRNVGREPIEVDPSDDRDLTVMVVATGLGVNEGKKVLSPGLLFLDGYNRRTKVVIKPGAVAFLQTGWLKLSSGPWQLAGVWTGRLSSAKLEYELPIDKAAERPQPTNSR